MFGKKK